MGANQSSSIQSVTDILNKNITNVLSEQTTNVSGHLSTVNQVNVKIGNMKGACVIRGSQNITSDQKIKAIASIQSAADLVNVMKGAIDKTVDSNQSSVNGFLSTAFSNQNNKQDIKNNLHNIVENNIKNVNTSNILSVSSNLNNGVYEFGNLECTPGQVIDLSQDAVVAQYVDALGTLTGQVLSKNDQINSAVEKLSASQTSQNAGAAEFLKALTGPWLIFIFGLLVVVFLFFKFGGLDKLEKLAEKKMR
jgi:hypothetical protein